MKIFITYVDLVYFRSEKWLRMTWHLASNKEDKPNTTLRRQLQSDRREDGV
jgi:hypothetical protein